MYFRLQPIYVRLLASNEQLWLEAQPLKKSASPKKQVGERDLLF
jgi:hypothetical protein